MRRITEAGCGVAHDPAGRAFVVLMISTGEDGALSVEQARELGVHLIAAAGVASVKVDELRRLIASQETGLILPPSKGTT